MVNTDARPSRRHPLLDTLFSQFKVFRDCRPLAVGIHKAILAQLPETSAAELRAAMRAHTASTRYLKAIAAESVRFDLAGQVVGEITNEQREIANATLRDRFRKAAELRKVAQRAQIEAQREREAHRQRQEKLAQLAARFNRR